MMNIKIFISGIGNENDINDLFYNWSESELSELEEVEYKETPTLCSKSKEFKALYEGNLPDEMEESLIKMTHHAEFLYEDTGVQYVHVEICLNGIWYGGSDHESLERGVLNE